MSHRSLQDTDSLIQHAWRKAVENDSTFIIFNCGNFERIGFRHRASQILYLSELIDVRNCKDPAYGNIHLNLFLAIFRDAVDRTQVIGSTVSRKRSRKQEGPGDLRRSKRRRVTEREEVSSVALLLNDPADRNVVLISFKYGVYNSPAPTAFMRTVPSLTPTKHTFKPIHLARKRTLHPHQYLSLVLTSRIAEGAVGVVHAAALKICRKNGEVVSSEAVVKLAFSSDQKEKMRYEYSVYQPLVTAAVKGVPVGFGLFQDANEMGPLALITSHEGIAFWTCRRVPGALGELSSASSTSGSSGPSTFRQVKITADEGAALLGIMKDIHRSGVVHNDIRPENITLKEDGSVAVIDFDRATLNPTRGAKQRERKHVLQMINGRFTEPAGMMEMLSTPSNAEFSDTDSEKG